MECDNSVTRTRRILPIRSISGNRGNQGTKPKELSQDPIFGCEGPSGVRKKRRVTLQIEHREISVSAGTGGNAVPERTSGQEADYPASCPNCGSADLISLSEAIADPALNRELMRHSAGGDGIHLGPSPSGRWWICRKSLDSGQSGVR